MEIKSERSQTLPVITRLHEAALHGNTNSLTILLQQDPLILDRCIVERSTQYTQSPLHVAANMGHLEFTRMLLELKPELAEVFDQLKIWSSLHIAAAKGHLQIIQALFNAKPQMSFACDREGRTPVHVAVVNGQVKPVTWFCQTQPLAVRERTAGGETVFHLCVKYNQPTILKLLIGIADLNDLLNSVDGNGNTVLHLAVHAKQTQMLQILQKHLEIGDNFMNKEKHHIHNNGAFSQTSQSIEAATTRLYEAIWKGEVNTVLSLLRQDPLILDRCVDQNTGRFMQSPLHIAVKVGHLEMVQTLINLNPSMCLARDEDGRTPIHVAALKGQVNVLQVLHNANSDAAREKTNNGESILHLCVKHKQSEALTSLVGLTGNDGDQIVKSEDNNGNTILHLAVISKQPEMVKYLLEHPTIEKNRRNKRGMTAVDIHREQSKKNNGDKSIEQSLCQAHAKPAKDALDRQEDKKWLEDQRSALMVVASLIATMAFQAGINPPGGVAQSSEKDQDIIFTGEVNNVYAGTALWSYSSGPVYNIVQISNTVGLISSLSVILFLISGLPCKRYFLPLLRITLWIAVTSTGVTYTFAMVGVSLGDNGHVDKLDKLVIAAVCLVFSWFGFVGIILFGNVIRFIFKKVGWKRRESLKNICKKIFCCS